jgi:RHS repeat-associated protein
VTRFAQRRNIDEPLATQSGGTISYYHADGLGSITSLTNSAGAVVATYTYDAFGNLTASTGSVANPLRYTAREFDAETGLYFYRARYYDPPTGRFLSQDPIGFSAGTNFYAYVSGNPISRRDPSGKDWLNGVGNFSAGAGDILSFGLTNWIRNKMGTNQFVDKCSGLYHAGQFTGTAILTAIVTSAASSALTATAPTDEISVEYTQQVLDRMAETADDPYHNFPSSFNQYVVENGQIGTLTGNYVQYELPGSIGSGGSAGYTQGIYQVGGNWLDNTFQITHSFFKPF